MPQSLLSLFFVVVVFIELFSLNKCSWGCCKLLINFHFWKSQFWQLLPAFFFFLMERRIFKAPLPFSRPEYSRADTIINLSWQKNNLGMAGLPNMFNRVNNSMFPSNLWIDLRIFDQWMPTMEVILFLNRYWSACQYF